VGKSIIDLSSVTTVGLYLAKHVFQVHGVDASGRRCGRQGDEAQQAFWSSSLRCPPALSGSKPEGRRITGRELIRLGHDARMMPPSYVKPYIHRQKNDASARYHLTLALAEHPIRSSGRSRAASSLSVSRHRSLPSSGPS
jgi:transposase